MTHIPNSALEKLPQWGYWFKPGELPFRIDPESGVVQSVNESVDEDSHMFGCYVGWTLVEIDNLRYTREIFESKNTGSVFFYCKFVGKIANIKFAVGMKGNQSHMVVTDGSVMENVFGVKLDGRGAVTHVHKDSQARRKGVKQGWFFLTINGTPFESWNQDRVEESEQEWDVIAWATMPLRVTVQECTDLGYSINNLPDPVCTCRVEPVSAQISWYSHRSIFQTGITPKTNRPQWNFEGELWGYNTGCGLHFYVKDASTKGLFRDNICKFERLGPYMTDFIGSGRVQLQTTSGVQAFLSVQVDQLFPDQDVDVEDLVSANDEDVVLVLGCYRCGKSTIANALLGESKFHAGIVKEPDRGLTQRPSAFRTRAGDAIVVDVPGVMDPAGPDTVARLITKVFTKYAGKNCKVVLVCKLEFGMVNPVHRAAMKLILEAVPSIGSSFGIVFNNCEPEVMRYAKDDEWKQVLCDVQQRGFPCVSQHLLFLPYDGQWAGADAAPLLSAEQRRFFDLLPTAKWEPSGVGNVLAPSIDQLLDDPAPRTHDEAALQLEAMKKSGERARQARRNFAFAFAAFPAVILLTWPAIATTLGINGWDNFVFFEAPLPDGHSTKLQVGLFPYDAMLTAYCAYSAASAWRQVTNELDDFLVFGRDLQLPCASSPIKKWQVWMLRQIADFACDLNTFCVLRKSPDDGFALAWLCTLVVSAAVPLLYASKKAPEFFQVLMLEGVFEDSPQVVIALMKLVSTKRQFVPMPVVFSFLLSFIGLIELAGTLYTGLGRYVPRAAHARERLLG